MNKINSALYLSSKERLKDSWTKFLAKAGESPLWSRNSVLCWWALITRTSRQAQPQGFLICTRAPTKSYPTHLRFCSIFPSVLLTTFLFILSLLISLSISQWPWASLHFSALAKQAVGAPAEKESNLPDGVSSREIIRNKERWLWRTDCSSCWLQLWIPH